MTRKLIFILFFLFLFVEQSSSTTSYYRNLVKKDIFKSLSLIGNDKNARRIKRQWNSSRVEELTRILICIENVVGINHKKMLSIILTESEMDIFVIAGPNRNKSYDYGLIQQNSPYLIERYKAAKRILKRNHIKYTNDIFDISVNVMSGALVIRDFKYELEGKGIQGEYCHFVAYNTGPTGYLDKTLPMKIKRARYLKRFKKFLVKL